MWLSPRRRTEVVWWVFYTPTFQLSGDAEESHA